MTFTPLSKSEIDPRLQANLEPGEVVVWHGHPEVAMVSNILSMTLAAALALVGVGLVAGLGPLVVPSLAFSEQTTLIPGLVLLAAGAVLFFTSWRRRAASWCYGATDKRLILVLNGKIFKTAVPAETQDLRIFGSTVYWKKEQISQTDSGRSQKRMIGFYGMRDPAATKRMIDDWRENAENRTKESANRFVASKSDDQPISDGSITRVIHPETGLKLDVPSDWLISVSLDDEGPLKVFGVTLLKRVIKKGPERPYGTKGYWNVLKVNTDDGSGLQMIIKNTPMTQTLDVVLNDPWNATMGLEIVQTEPNLTIGAFSGFSLVRKLPRGGQLLGFSKTSSPIMSRMIWLGDGRQSVEITGIARIDQPEIQYAVDAMVNSLSS
jgi:hypothetical protein